MDYKKAYEDALERAKGIYNDNPSSSTAKFVCGQIFPEIKESEDKRIRECLVTIVKVNKRSSFGLECNHGATWDEMLAYLEKQKEKRPAEWSEENEKIWKDIFDLCNRFGYDDACRLLKSISRRSWKPSEEQMDALKEASTSWMNEHMGNCELLESLYNDLTKL